MAFELSDEEMGNCFDMAIVEISKWEEFQNKLRAEFGKQN